jgi:SAM-dependent methyltransferase
MAAASTMTMRAGSHGRTRWGSRAAAIYDDAYAERYRQHDERRTPGDAIDRLSRWLHDVCIRCGPSIDVLDLGCGTGRYFGALTGVRRLVAVDVSRPMLDRARPRAGALGPLPGGVELVEADFLNFDCGATQFDLVYSIGVLAEHSPFDDAIASRVRRWLKPGGRFAFSAVHPGSQTVPRTFKRRVAERLMPAAPEPLRSTLRDRLMRDGLYADELRIRNVLAGAGMEIESIGPFQSDVHLQVLTVATVPRP